MPTLFFVGGIFLVTLYFVETMSWVIKVANRQQGLGHVVATTNIWLYGARSLMILVLVINFYLYESGWPLWTVVLAAQISLIFSAASHLPLFFQVFRQPVLAFSSRILRLGRPVDIRPTGMVNKKLTLQTALSVVFFVLALMAPVFLAERFPMYSLTASIGTPLFNAVGTVLLLIGVEPRLYAGIDNDSVDDLLISYLIGRCGGMIASTVLLSFGYL